MRQAISRSLRACSSLGTSCILFALLILLTFLGTMHEVDHGLLAARSRYFESFLVVHRFFGVLPVPLPGGILLLGLLAFNLLLGGLMRARKGRAQVGVLIAHAGILLLIAGGMVSFLCAEKGQLVLREGEKANRFQSDRESEFVVCRQEDPENPVFKVSAEAAKGHEAQRPARFQDPSLPFTISLGGYIENAIPELLEAEGGSRASLREVPPDPEAGRNLPGAHLVVSSPDGAALFDGVVWAGRMKPAVFTINGSSWRVELRKREFPLPFAVELERFEQVMHPGTAIPKAFASHVNRIEDSGFQVPATIEMNKPLRCEGYTFYQASWGTAADGVAGAPYSVLAVVRDPAERMPLVASTVISAGLAIHFLMKLRRYLIQRARAGSAAE